MTFTSLPLVVDLDGTLIRTDLLHESTLQFVRANPMATFSLPGWLVAGKAVLKARIAGETSLDVTVLPYHTELLTWLTEQKAAGRQLVLATASDSRYAEAVAAHIGLFDLVLASDGTINLAGDNKRAALVARFGERGFCYAGNSSTDLAVWQSAASAVVVSDDGGLIERARRLGPLEQVFGNGGASRLALWLRAMRLHQWLKNLLIFVPLFAAHRADAHSLPLAALAFLAFGLAASSVYLCNDLIDLPHDRRHRSKRKRPFAAGALPVWQGVLAFPCLLLGSAVLSSFLHWHFAVALAGYYLLTLMYSFVLKERVIMDVTALALLYTARLVAGAAAVAVPLSFWLLGVSMFLFLSLALLKRYSELIAQRNAGFLGKAPGRGYGSDDIEMLSSLGASAGYGAVVVMALYVNSSAVVGLYREPRLIWGACPLLLYWVSRAWIIAHRGQMHDDPVVFAARDRTSIVIGFALLILFWLAR